MKGAGALSPLGVASGAAGQMGQATTDVAVEGEAFGKPLSGKVAVVTGAARGIG